MANGVVTTARFTPYTFDEMMKPLMYLQNKHDALMAANAEMASKMAVMESFLPKESRAYKEMYEPYMQQVQDMATKLTDRGVLDNKGNFSPEMVNSLRDLRIGFSKTFTPLDDALKRYKLRQENDVLVKNKDPKMIGVFGRKEFDDFLDDPTLGTDSYISADQFYQEAAKNFQALARGEFNTPSLKKFSKYYDLFSQTAGMTPDQVIDFITKSKGGQFAQEFLNAMFEDQLATYGYADKLDSNGKNRLYSAFKSAMPYLTGPTQHQLVDNGEKEKEMMAMRAAMTQQQNEPTATAGLSYINNTDPGDAIDEDFLKEAQEFKDSFASGLPKGETNNANSMPTTYVPNSININPSVLMKAFSKDDDGVSARFNKRAYLPNKGDKTYDAMTALYNSDPVLKQQIIQIFNKIESGKKISKEDAKLLVGSRDRATVMQYGYRVNPETGASITPQGVKNIIDQVQPNLLRGNNIPEGMNQEDADVTFKTMSNPSMRFDLRKNKVVISGLKKVDDKEQRVEFRLPIEHLTTSRNIEVNYFDATGNPQKESLPTKQFFNRMKELKKDRSEFGVNKYKAFLDAAVKQIAGFAYGTKDVGNMNFGQTQVDLTQ